MSPDLSRELRVARELAQQAGRSIMSRYGEQDFDTKSGGSPVTIADRAANQLIVDGLREAFPEDAVLSEEMSDQGDRLSQRRVWIVDPLDGTKEFLAGNGEFAVMIGLAVDGRPVLGVVHAPATGDLYSASAGMGASHDRPDGSRLQLRIHSGQSPPRMIASRSHRDRKIERVRVLVGAAEPTRSGSVGLKCARVADGTHDLYVHPVPYLCEWDTCAPEVIAAEAGAVVTDCQGNPLRYNKAHPGQPDGILVTAPGLEHVREAIMTQYREDAEMLRP